MHNACSAVTGHTGPAGHQRPELKFKVSLVTSGLLRLQWASLTPPSRADAQVTKYSIQ